MRRPRDLLWVSLGSAGAIAALAFAALTLLFVSGPVPGWMCGPLALVMTAAALAYWLSGRGLGLWR